MKTRLSGAVKVKGALSAACAALFSLVAWQLSSPAIRDATGASSETALGRLPPLPSDTFDLAPLDAHSAMVDRPLFDQTRRPADPAAEGPVQAEPAARVAPPSWTLIGTVIAAATSSALLWDPGTRQFVRLEHGMSHDGWRLVEVTRRSVLLENDSKRHELTMPP